MQAWLDLEDAMEESRIVTGYVSSKVKGGLRVTVNGIMAFLPGSLVDIRPIKDTTPFENKECELKVIKIDRKRNNVVVSRKAVLEGQSGVDLEALIETLKEGSVVKGIVKNITDYGAFVDLGGIDGLLHITDLAWKRIKHPSEILNIGDEIDARVLKFDKEKNRVSLGLKQLDEDPWVGLSRRSPIKTKVFGKVSNLTDYGAFIEIETGIEGLVHVSEMDWTNKNIHPSKAVQLGDEVEVMILEIDEDRRRLSLGMKQCKDNPWDIFANSNNKDDKIKGNIKSITDFGVFIGLPGDIDGLIHLSDIAWSDQEAALKNYKRGDEVESVILSIDVDKERISLGIKQLSDDPNADKKIEAEEQPKKETKKKTDAPENAGTTNLGALLSSGKYIPTRVVACGGSECKEPAHVNTLVGSPISSLVSVPSLASNGDKVRVISGSPLTGAQVEANGFLGAYDYAVALLPEGNEPRFLLTSGWLGLGLDRFSLSKSYFTWLRPNSKEFTLDTNMGGEERAFVVTGEYEKVFPFDIYPVHLLKSILVNDIDSMEKLGIYEVAPEDFALCEYGCTSKIPVQQIVREGLETLRTELG